MDYIHFYIIVNYITNKIKFHQIKSTIIKMRGHTTNTNLKTNSLEIVCIFTNRSDYYVTSTT